MQKAYRNALEIEWVSAESFQALWKNLPKSPAAPSPVKEHSIPQQLSDILAQTYLLGCSDIHFEPHASSIRIATRKQGQLSFMQEWPIVWQAPLENIIRLQANFAYSNHRHPVSGQFAQVVGSEKIFCRASLLPTLHGANIVIRFHSPQNTASFDFKPLMGTQFAQRIQNATSGLWLIASAVGNGKTTSYYQLLKAASNRQRVFSFEDPIEISQASFIQIEIQPSELPEWSKRLLRQNANIVGLGEIRSKEQLKFVVNTALTGHCTLATIHAKSLEDVPHRLQIFGYSPSQQQNFLRGVLFQHWEGQGAERHIELQEKLYT